MVLLLFLKFAGPSLRGVTFQVMVIQIICLSVSTAQEKALDVSDLALNFSVQRLWVVGPKDAICRWNEEVLVRLLEIIQLSTCIECCLGSEIFIGVTYASLKLRRQVFRTIFTPLFINFTSIFFDPILFKFLQTCLFLQIAPNETWHNNQCDYNWYNDSWYQYLCAYWLAISFCFVVISCCAVCLWLWRWRNRIGNNCCSRICDVGRAAVVWLNDNRHGWICCLVLWRNVVGWVRTVYRDYITWVWCTISSCIGFIRSLIIRGSGLVIYCCGGAIGRGICSGCCVFAGHDCGLIHCYILSCGLDGHIGRCHIAWSHIGWSHIGWSHFCGCYIGLGNIGWSRICLSHISCSDIACRVNSGINFNSNSWGRICSIYNASCNIHCGWVNRSNGSRLLNRRDDAPVVINALVEQRCQICEWSFVVRTWGARTDCLHLCVHSIVAALRACPVCLIVGFLKVADCDTKEEGGVTIL